MTNSTLKCKHCKKYFPRGQIITLPGGRFCSMDHVILHGKAKAQATKAKRDRAQHKAAKQQVKKRTGKGGYYENLKTALHYYVKHCLRKGEPCYTCGNPQTQSNCHHVGHFVPAKEVDPRRFMLENLRIQCYSCNSIHSGRRMEYRQRMIEEKGIDHVEWLECEANHKSLLEQYPDIESIKKETAKYRRLARLENGC